VGSVSRGVRTFADGGGFSTLCVWCSSARIVDVTSVFRIRTLVAMGHSHALV
jgi:hypothetical protein